MTRCAVCGRACEGHDTVPGAVADWLTSETVCQRRTCRHALDRLEEEIDRPGRMDIIRGWAMYTTPGHGCVIDNDSQPGRQTRLDEFDERSVPVRILEVAYRAIFGDRDA